MMKEIVGACGVSVDTRQTNDLVPCTAHKAGEKKSCATAVNVPLKFELTFFG